MPSQRVSGLAPEVCDIRSRIANWYGALSDLQRPSSSGFVIVQSVLDQTVELARIEYRSQVRFNRLVVLAIEPITQLLILRLRKLANSDFNVLDARHNFPKPQST